MGERSKDQLSVPQRTLYRPTPAVFKTADLLSANWEELNAERADFFILVEPRSSKGVARVQYLESLTTYKCGDTPLFDHRFTLDDIAGLFIRGFVTLMNENMIDISDEKYPIRDTKYLLFNKAIVPLRYGEHFTPAKPHFIKVERGQNTVNRSYLVIREISQAIEEGVPIDENFTAQLCDHHGFKNLTDFRRKLFEEVGE